MPDIDDQLLLIVGRIEGKLDALALWAVKHEKDDEEAYAKIAALEKWRAYFIGIAAAVGALTGGSITGLAKVLGIGP